MKVYISLPISGYDLDERKRTAAAAAEMLRADGHEPLNPFDSDEPGMTYGQYLGKDVAIIIDQADAVMLLPGYSRSVGCFIERTVASATGKILIPQSEYINDKEKYKP